MAPMWHLAWRSVANRRLTAALTVAAIALAVAMLLGVERLRQDAREGFANTISGTDLVVGARSAPLPLLLYSVFHLGSATNNVSMASLRRISQHPQVAWLVPITLGDSHHGFSVVGTSHEFFARYRFGHDQPLRFDEGIAFGGLFEAVVGAEVGADLGYRAGARIVLNHGSGPAGFAGHDDKPFGVIGVLARTGTPVDRSVLVSLESLEAIHVDWHGGSRMPGISIPLEHVTKFDLEPKAATAALVGLKSRHAVLGVQRFVNEFPDEPLLALIPGATLQELWTLVGAVERVLKGVSALVVLVGLAGLVAVMMASLGERRRELAIVRALGAGPFQIFLLLAVECLVLSIIGCVFGLGLVQAAVAFAGPWFQAEYGLVLTSAVPGKNEWLLLGAVLLAALAASVIPGVRAYRYCLADGLTIRI